MKKAVLMCMQMRAIEVSPARYQLIREMKDNNIEVYLVLKGKLNASARKIRGDIKHYLNAESMSNREIRNKIINYKPDIVIAFTYEDTEVIYTLPFTLKNTRFYYYNLEINTHGYNLLSCEKYTWEYFMKAIKYPITIFREAFYTKRCELLVIQDEERKRVAHKYLISHKRTMLIPNSYVLDNDIKSDVERSGIVYSGGARKQYLIDYLHNFKSITKVPVVFAGSFDEWSKEQILKLHRTNSNIVMENQILDLDEYTEYLQKYAVGLVCYSMSDNDNINYMGLSSGKFFKHLSIGQPVIVMGCPRISREVRRYNLGVVVQDASQIEEAYQKIMDNYSYYFENVVRTYQNKYDFHKIIKPFLETLANN